MFTTFVQGKLCVKGIDISDWQPGVDFNAVAMSGIAFVVAKATEGTSFKAKSYITNRDGARAHGMKFGAYHWIKPSSSGAAQAKHFLATTNNGEGCDFLVLDAEEAGLTNAHVLDWCRAVESVGKPIVIYCGAFSDPKSRDAGWGKYTPWLAAYPAGYTEDPHPATLRTPVSPQPWGRWDIWQYSSSGRVPGVNGKCDVNVADINWFNSLGETPAQEEEEMHYIQRTSDNTPWLIYGNGTRINMATLDGVTGETQVAALKYVGVEEKPKIETPDGDWWILRTSSEPTDIRAAQALTKLIIDSMAKMTSGEHVDVDPAAIAEAVLDALKEKL